MGAPPVTEARSTGPVILANKIADALVVSAISDGKRATWLGTVVEEGVDGRRVIQRTGDASLYQGSAGIAWACAEAAAVLDRDDLSDLARVGAWGAVTAARDADGTGLYDGLTGIGLAALVVAIRVGDEALAARGRGLLDQAAASPAAGPELIRGSAGVLLGLLAADRVSGDDRWLSAARWHGGNLLASADRQPWGSSWQLPDMNEPALCGLAHGAAGIAWALAELHAATGDAESAAACAAALQFERSWFDRRQNTWPDLRTGLVPPGFPVPHPTLWCHGAAGIGLSRLRIHQVFPHPSLLAEAASALQSSVAAASTEPHFGVRPFGLTVCHGLGGTLELLAAAHEVLGEEEHLTTARWLLDRAVAELGDEVEVWPTGVEGGSWDPGLMTGLAGTMLALLRMAWPRRLPSVGLLLAEAPPTAALT